MVQLPLTLVNGNSDKKIMALAKIHIQNIWLKPLYTSAYVRWLKPTAIDSLLKLEKYFTL